jgi:small nuclear ribonucleoprotein (snRNP)-like protein
MEEVASLLEKTVTVQTTAGKVYTGKLSGVETKTLTVCLTNARDEQGIAVRKLFITGGTISQIYSTETPFNLPALAERLERVFPRMVKVMEGAGVILVMDKIRVTEKGLLEGTGPAAERVQKVYEEFVREHTA